MSVQNLKDLVKRQGSSMGLTNASSSIVVANLNGTTAPLCMGTAFDDDESSTDDFRVIEFVLDGSTSMEDVMDALRGSMNDIVFPGLLGGAASQVGAIRFGGLVYATGVRPLWPGFQKLGKNYPRLTAAELSADGSTSLNQGVMDGVTALTTQALIVKAETGTHPECTLVCIGDGANRGRPGEASAQDVRTVMESLDPRYFSTVFLGFETWEAVDFKQVGKDLGFRDIQEAKALPGETKADQQKRMRNVMGVFSQNLVKRVSSSQVKTAPTGASAAAGGTGFWTAAD